MEDIAHWINGTPQQSAAGPRIDVHDPATGEATGSVGVADATLVDAAVTAASNAFPEWSQRPLLQRQRVMFAYRELLVEHHDELAALITREHGKTLDDAHGEVQRGLEVVEYACALPELLKGAYSAQVATGVDTFSVRQPLGVCVGITPFNFPAMVPMWMFPMAIACGNTFILKPSEKDPSTSVRLAELLKEAGLPDGVMNVVHGDQTVVERLLADERIEAVSFVGSTAVARHIYATATRNGMRVQALGGAKNHMVVLPDADLDQAADAAVSAGYGSAGERCMAISVVVAVGAIADRLVEKITERTVELTIGPGAAPSSQMGPLITAEHRERVISYVDAGVSTGAALVVDGRDVVSGQDNGGYFLGPCLFDHVTPEMSIYTDEIFGPVLSVVRVNTYEDAVRLVNDNPYGNGVAVFTNDGAVARRFHTEIRAGMVGVNVPIPVPLSFHSFGGWKQSLFGGHGIYGPEGIHFYTRLKTAITRWPDPAERGVDLGFPRES